MRVEVGQSGGRSEWRWVPLKAGNRSAWSGL